jgi:outer membrane protein OmpA-like peptidoglycan-associated protein
VVTTRRFAPPLLALLLSGCGNAPSLDPVSWWHQMEGGPIAQDRPPPPNSTAPYPNLLSVPDRPPPPNTAVHAQIQQGLISDRANAVYEDQVQPIPTQPGAPARSTAAPGGEEATNASLPAANAPPPSPQVVAPRQAPVTPVTAAALPPPPPGAGALQPVGPSPEMPVSPPPPPDIAGLPIAPTTPTQPPVAPPPVAAPLPPSAPVAIGFPANSAVLSETANGTVRKLATSRGSRNVLVTGYGDAASVDPATQAAALPLGLDRARAVAAALRADGVPSNAIRITAEPLGSGAAARLVQ